MNTDAHVLLIDDDIKFCRLISEYLADFGFKVESAHNGPDGLRKALQEPWQAVILDVMLPIYDGFKVLRKLREETSVPILMLTGLGEEKDRILGLELGADDYLPKTSSARELLARLRAVLRRTSVAIASDLVDSELKIGPLAINLDTYHATFKNAPLSLTTVEFDLLVVLAKSPGRVKTREGLINEIRNRDYEVCDRSIDVHISALRKKLNDNPRNPKYIRTIRGVGYSLIHEVEE